MMMMMVVVKMRLLSRRGGWSRGRRLNRKVFSVVLAQLVVQVHGVVQMVFVLLQVGFERVGRGFWRFR